MPASVGSMISRMTRACRSGVRTAAGEYAPIPPVFGPLVAIADALVILRGAEGERGRAVAKGEEARLLAV